MFPNPERIGKPCLRRSGAQGPGLVGGRGPAGQEDQLHRDRHPPPTGRAGLPEQRLGTGEQSPRGNAAVARGQGIGLARVAQIRDQRSERGIAEVEGHAVGDRHRQPGPLQKGAEVPYLAHGQHPGAEAAGHLHFRFGQGGTQGCQCVSARHDTEKQAVGRKGAAALDELAYRIVGPVQGHGMHDKVMGARFESQDRCLGLDPPARKTPDSLLPDPGQSADEGRGPKGFVNLGEPFLDFSGHLAVQEPVAVPVQGTAAMRGKGRAVGQTGRFGHGTIAVSTDRRLCGVWRMKALGQTLLHLVYPPSCIGCGVLVSEDHRLCGTCWGTTPFLSGPVCRVCSLPLTGEAPGPGEDICDRCLHAPPPWERGAAVLLYEGTARRLVLRLKHGDREDLAAPLGDWMAARGRSMLGPDTIVAPVPLHWGRLFRRRYNQAALLAARIALATGCAHVPDLFRRTRRTLSQDGLGRAEREVNLAGAIAVRDTRRAMIAGRPLVVVDDVLTTGATLAATAEAARAAGAGTVSVLVLARVAKPA